MLVIVVLVLATLQYRWIGELSEAHESRAQLRLRATVSALIDAVDTEATRSVLAFELPIGAELEALEGRWAEWNRAARWPQVVSGIALLESSDGIWKSRWLGSPAKSDIASLLPLLEPSFPTTRERPERIVVSGSAMRQTILDGQPAFVLPLSAFSARPGMLRLRAILVHFDADYLARSVFPELLKTHSTAEDREEFSFEVRGNSERGIASEISAHVFRFRPDCLVTQPGPRTIKLSGGLPIDDPPGRRSPSQSTLRRVPPVELANPVALASLIQGAGHCNAMSDTGSAGSMQIIVRTREARMNSPFTRFRWRNQLVSGAVLLTLVVTMGVLVISAERARRLARLQTAVAAGISHELRTPLASLRVAADNLRIGQVENLEQARHYGEIIDALSRRLGHVVDQVLALTSATEGNGLGRRCPVPVAEVTDVAIKAVSPTLSRAHMRIERSVPADIPDLVADPDTVARCLMNLIENAIKYAASGRSVVLSAQSVRRFGKSLVEISVEDRGPGINDEEAAAVFEPFYRGASGRQSREPGSGLGLAIVKSSVEANGGWVELEPVDPHGCRVRLFFPAADAHVSS